MSDFQANNQSKDAVLGGELGKQNKFRRDPKLQADDVISVTGSNVRRGLIPHHNTFKFSEIEEQVLPKILQNSEIKQLQEGIEVEILSPHQPWRKGKLQLKIEYQLTFIPEESGE